MLFTNDDAIEQYKLYNKNNLIFLKCIKSKIQFTYYVTNKELSAKKKNNYKLIFLKSVERNMYKNKNTIFEFLKTINNIDKNL